MAGRNPPQINICTWTQHKLRPDAARVTSALARDLDLDQTLGANYAHPASSTASMCLSRLHSRILFFPTMALPNYLTGLRTVSRDPTL
jgi:hypothetical protein